MESGRNLVADALRRRMLEQDGSEATHILKRATLMKRKMSDGAVAGTVVGVVLGVALIAFCLYPVILGQIKRRRKHRLVHTHPFDLDTEVGVAPDAQPVTLPNDSERRLSGTGSIKPADQNSRGDLPHHAGGDHWEHARNGVAPGTYNTNVPHTINTDGTFSAPGVQTSATWENGDAAPFQSYDGDYYPGADPSEPKGANADYYSPSVPSEAFGMYTLPSPTAPSESSKIRLRGSSLRNSVRDLFRGMSGHERTTSSATGDEKALDTVDSASPKMIMPEQDASSSPTQMSPTIPTPPPASLSRGMGGSNQTLPNGSPPPTDRSFRFSPPARAGPGTVNPMDIMPASSETEQWHRTDHELYMASQPHSSPPVSSENTPCHHDGAVVDSPSPASFSPPAPVHIASISAEPTRHDTDQTVTQSSHQDVEMGNNVGTMSVPSHNYLQPNPDPNRHLSYPSDQSTPFHGLSSTNPSTHNTPSTQVDTPSPQSSAVHSDFRHSASPAAGVPSPHSGQGQYACQLPGCGQVFDQHHKLNHHLRYHSKDHKCPYPNCGKGFGTKTHLQRHINDRHEKKKKYHCAVPGCDYSKTGGKAFPRKDNWKRHMTKIHHVQAQDLPEPVEIDADMAGT